MNILQSTCCLNNQAVELLISGQSSRASKTLQNALQLLAGDDGEHPNKNESVDDFDIGCSRSIGVPDLQASAFFIYGHAIIIMEPAALQKITDEMICYYSSVVLFNWALTLHREGILGRKTNLKKAASIYARCLLVLAAIKSEQTADILTLLVLNNLAQIHSELCDYSECSHCLARVSNLLVEARSMDGCILTSKDVDAMVLNAMFSPTAAQAA